MSQPEEYLIDLEEEQNQQALTPDIEWVLLQRMRDGVVPLMPILINPTEDLRDHYEKHLEKTTTEEFQAMPDEVKQVWMAHLQSYTNVLKLLDKKTKKEEGEKIEMKEVAV